MDTIPADRTQLLGDLKQLFIKELNLKRGAAEIGDSAPLFGPDGLNIDSLDALQVGIAAEQRWGIKIPIETDEGKKALSSVSSLADYIIANGKK